MDYPAFVSSIVKPGLEIHASLDAVKCHILHMTLGIMDEFFEIERAVINHDEENIKEEIGDLLFYIEGCRLYFPRQSAIPPRPDMRETLGALASTVKKWTMYNQPLDIERFNHLLLALQGYAEETAQCHHFDLKDVYAHNMKKLSARYPVGYSDRDALERKDKQ